MISYRTVGNGLHVLNLLNIAVYGGSLLTYAYNSNTSIDPTTTTTVFDKVWLQAGFCLPHDENDNNIEYRTTHDLSGYAMVLIGLLGIALQQFLNRRSSIIINDATTNIIIVNNNN